MASRIDLVDERKKRMSAGMPTLGDTRKNVSTLPGEPELAKDAYEKPLKVPEKIPRVPAVAPAEKPLATPAPTVPTSKYIGMDFDEAMQDGGIKPEDFWKLQEKAYQEGKRGGYSITDIINRVKSRDPDYETPEQRKKREKEEAISRAISGLGNVISNAANFAFAVKGAVPGVYNNQATDERLRQIKEKRDALKRKYDTILMNAELGDVAYQRDMEAAREKAARDQALKERMKEIEHKYKMGEISSEAAFDQQQEILRQQGYMARTVFNAEAQAKEGARNRANAREIAKIRKNTESSEKMIRIPTRDGKYVDIRQSSYNNPTVVGNIYSSLPEEFKVTVTGPYNDGTVIKPNPTLAEMQSAIGRAIERGEEVEFPESIVGSKARTLGITVK